MRGGDTVSAMTEADAPSRSARRAGEGGGRGGRGRGTPRPPRRPRPPSGRLPAGWWRAERLLPHGLHAVAFVPLVLLGLIVGLLIWKALPAIRYNGLGFFVHNKWFLGDTYANLVTTHGIRHPPLASYGALPIIVGTLLSSAFAVVLAVPVALGTAFFVVEKLPRRLSSGVGFCLEVLAGVPSVVFGLWGVFTLGPFLSHHVATIWANHLPDLPVLGFFRGPTGGGQGLFTASVVLAIMILPIIAATARDLLRQVPRPTIEGAVALGMTDSESVRAVSLPWIRSGLIGATMLGLGRALGETIAVAMVSNLIFGSNVHSFYGGFATIAATIVSLLDGAQTDASGLATSALAEAALLLVVITLIANVGARLLVRRVATTALPVGRGI